MGEGEAMNLKSLAGIACAVFVAAALAPVPASGLVPRTVLCDEFGYIT